MQRILLVTVVVAIALSILVTAVFAQSSPEFKLGFKALADQLPETVGQPLENEQSAANGDSLQRTTNGLMVWRKADNWTAFTDGYQTWVNGPNGVQARLNDQRFDWEAAIRTPTPTPVQTRSASATPSPTPTPAPAPAVNVYRVSAVNGEELESNSVWVLGELRNDGAIPAYSIKVTARLLSETGSAIAEAIQSYNYLGPGEVLGFRLRLDKPTAYARADVSVSSVGTSFARYEKLAVAGTPMKKVATTIGGDAFEWTSSVTNNGSKALTACIAYVWFLDEYDNVLWAETSFPSTNLAPGASAEFVVRTTRHKYNPKVAGINQVRAYAVGIQQP